MIVVIGSLWLAAQTVHAQSATPYPPNGYVVQTTSQVGGPYYAPTMPAPAPRTTSIRGLWIPGLVGLPVAWVATWVNASLSLPAGSDAVSASFIPLAGPWMVLASQSVDAPYYVITGIVQDLSLLCLVLGLVIRVEEPTARFAVGEGTLELSAAPSSSGGLASAKLTF